MRKKIIAGNWKMNTTLAEGKDLAEEVIRGTQPRVSKVIFFPPFPFLTEIGKLVEGKQNFTYGAQNLSQYDKGAYTGEVSAEMLHSAGCRYVLIGHSERRECFNETDDVLAAKIRQAFSQDLIPVFCCGEPLKEREAGTYQEFVAIQLRNVLFELDPEQLSSIIIAYEPIWAIGTGRTASPEEAQEMHVLIRNMLKEQFPPSVVDGLTLLYGGSVNAANAEALFSRPDVDGGLVGGASLKPGEFIAIINAMETLQAKK